MMYRIAQVVEMMFKIPDSEKEIARNIIKTLEKTTLLLKTADDHLNILYTPFKENNNIDVSKLEEKEGLVQRFKKQAKENYEEIVECGFNAFNQLNYFDKDTAISELSNTFKSDIGDLKKLVEELFDELDDFNQDNFQQTIIADIETIKATSTQLNDLIKDRLIKHLVENILSETWVNDMESKLNTKIEKTLPLITQLYNERQNVLQGVDIAKRPQALNPALQQKMDIPTDLRETESEDPMKFKI